MPLSLERIHRGNDSEFQYEREAIDFVINQLTNVDPYHAWALHDLISSTGRIYEIDLLVLGKKALYLIEIKSHPGRVEGDARDWTIRNGPQYWTLDNPLPLTNHKAKVLKGLLERYLPVHVFRSLWIEPLVFLSHPSVDVRLPPEVCSGITTRKSIVRALTHGETGSQQGPRPAIIDRPTMQALCKALNEIGLRPSASKRIVSDLKLQKLIDDGPNYQEFLAENIHTASKKRICCYQVPQATAQKERQILFEAAKREYHVLDGLGEHPGLLRCENFVNSDAIGPCLIFQDFPDSFALDVFLRRNPELPINERLHILQEIVEALDFCHRKKVWHRGLTPNAILVRRKHDKLPEVRLHRFHTAVRDDATTFASAHFDYLTDDSFLAYQAPELFNEPTRAGVLSDIFSLGALAYLLFSGEHPPLVPSTAGTRAASDGYRPSLVKDGLSPALDNHIANATHQSPSRRPTSALNWFNKIVEDFSPTDHTSIDPYNASVGHKLKLPTGGTLRVRAVLGSGATSRVFSVINDSGQAFALKVARDDASGERLASEASVLSQLKHPHIIQLKQALSIQDRACLLLEEASDATLQTLLLQYGTLHLEDAQRLGDQLLSALAYLEAEKILHCDIKPANIGYDAQKQGTLRLLDFSLASSGAVSISVGTPAYRDPTLRGLPQWDHAADRFSAAHVLYESLTSCRLTFEDLPGNAQEDVSVGILRDSNRFDPSVRDLLIQFFCVALHGDRTKRFPDAHSMQSAWSKIFDRLVSVSPRPASALSPPTDHSDQPQTTQATPSDDELAIYDLDTTLSALAPYPLDNRTISALDRAKIQTIGELLELSEADLNGLRGLGALLLGNLVDLCERLRARLKPPPTAKLVPDYIATPAPLRVGDSLGLKDQDIRKLFEVGITTTQALAAAPRAFIGRLLGDPSSSSKKHRPDIIASDLAKRLHDLNRASQKSPTTSALPDFELWRAQLLDTRRKNQSPNESQFLRTLIGLDELPAAPKTKSKSKFGEPPRAFASAKEVASRINADHKKLQAFFSNARKRWQQSPVSSSLESAVHMILSDLGGLATADEIASKLLQRHAPPDTAESLNRHPLALALLRVALELRDSDTLIFYCIIGQTVWIALDPQSFDILDDLGSTADELSTMPSLPSPTQAHDKLRPVIEDSPLLSLPRDRLFHISALASEHADVSIRHELYPRDLSPERIVALLAPNFLSHKQVSPEEFQTQAQTRFPRAPKLPNPPALDPLLAPLGFTYDPTSSVYIRKPAPTSEIITATSASATHHPTVSLMGPRLSRPMFVPPDSTPELRAFNEQLRSALLAGRFRALLVDADCAERASERVAAFLNLDLCSLDHLFLQSLRTHAERLRVKLEVIFETDRLGPNAPRWNRLRDLVSTAAQSVVDDLLSNRQHPRLLAHPGLFARFDLTNALEILIDRAQREDGAAVFLLVPSHHGGPPLINQRLPIPTPLPVQRIWIPREWARAPFSSPTETKSPADG